MAGAVGVIVINTLEGGEMLSMGDDGSGRQPDIVSVTVRCRLMRRFEASLLDPLCFWGPA